MKLAEFSIRIDQESSFRGYAYIEENDFESLVSNNPTMKFIKLLDLAWYNKENQLCLFEEPAKPEGNYGYGRISYYNIQDIHRINLVNEKFKKMFADYLREHQMHNESLSKS